jgi:hypothetical protein
MTTIDKQIDDVQDKIGNFALTAVNEFTAVTLTTMEIGSIWEFVLLNLAYLITTSVGWIFGMTSYTDGIISSILLNSRVYITYMYLQAARHRYTNNGIDKQ